MKYNNSPNLGWLFYKEYYKDIDFSFLLSNISGKEQIKEKNIRKFTVHNEELYSQKLPPTNEAEILSLQDTITELKTTYPGFISGSGYMHGTGHEQEFKIGFYFDHTTGLPILPGSSVKGVLRSGFCKDDGKYIDYLLNELNIKNQIDIKDLKKEIFDGEKYSGKTNDKGEKTYEPLNIYERDIFHDAIFTGNNIKFLSSDFITHHKYALKNPIPLQFLKILPGISVKFQFNLSDGILTKQNKLDLFKSIISDLGIGAKTNVGYGFLE